ncbi:MAG: hypothetical protein ACRBCI_14065 [Cellvibrionaceae bacterium]
MINLKNIALYFSFVIVNIIRSRLWVSCYVLLFAQLSYSQVGFVSPSGSSFSGPTASQDYVTAINNVVNSINTNSQGQPNIIAYAQGHIEYGGIKVEVGINTLGQVNVNGSIDTILADGATIKNIHGLIDPSFSIGGSGSITNENYSSDNIDLTGSIPGTNASVTIHYDHTDPDVDFEATMADAIEVLSDANLDTAADLAGAAAIAASVLDDVSELDTAVTGLTVGIDGPSSPVANYQSPNLNPQLSVQTDAVWTASYSTVQGPLRLLNSNNLELQVQGASYMLNTPFLYRGIFTEADLARAASVILSEESNGYGKTSNDIRLALGVLDQLAYPEIEDLVDSPVIEEAPTDGQIYQCGDRIHVNRLGKDQVRTLYVEMSSKAELITYSIQGRSEDRQYAQAVFSLSIYGVLDVIDPEHRTRVITKTFEYEPDDGQYMKVVITGDRKFRTDTEVIVNCGTEEEYVTLEYELRCNTNRGYCSTRMNFDDPHYRDRYDHGVSAVIIESFSMYYGSTTCFQYGQNRTDNENVTSRSAIIRHPSGLDYSLRSPNSFVRACISIADDGNIEGVTYD